MNEGYKCECQMGGRAGRHQPSKAKCKMKLKVKYKKYRTSISLFSTALSTTTAIPYPRFPKPHRPFLTNNSIPHAPYMPCLACHKQKCQSIDQSVNPVNDFKCAWNYTSLSFLLPFFLSSCLHRRLPERVSKPSVLRVFMIHRPSRKKEQQQNIDLRGGNFVD